MKLKAWMTKNNISQRKLADRLGITQGAVSRAMARADAGGQLPRWWATRIEYITRGKVRVADEWPPSEHCRRAA